MGQRYATRNAYGAPCRRCGVMVRADGGIVRSSAAPALAGTWCITCLRLDHDPEVSIPPVTAGAAHWMTVRVVGFVRKCWQCRQPVTCVSGLYPHTPDQRFLGTLLTSDGPRVMTAAAVLLTRIGRTDIAGTIRRVYSKTAQAMVDAVCCPACGGMQGNFFVGEETLDRVSGHGMAGLDTLGLAPCWTSHWQHLIHDPSVTSMGPVPDSMPS
ncbi:hypothetical protein ACWDUL_20430 [Nocardia niigatensis]